MGATVWAVEAWRGVAAWLVVWAHWAAPLGLEPRWSAYAFVGVDLFFVISGFVFAPTLLHGAAHWPAYALRRLMRIYPAYLAALAVYVLIAHQQGKPLLHLPEHVLMAHVQSREMAFYYNPAFWSLPAEVEFYALLPLLALALRRTGMRGLAALLLATAALRGALLWLADGHAQNAAYILLHHLPGMGVEFLLGTLAWRLAQYPAAQRWRSSWLAAGAAGMAATVVAYRLLQDAAPGWHNGQMGALTAACFALVLAGCVHGQPSAALVRAVGWWAGRLSYAVYLLHMAWLPWAKALVPQAGPAVALAAATLATLASAWALHMALEEPARQWARRVSAAWERRQKTSVSPG